MRAFYEAVNNRAIAATKIAFAALPESPLAIVPIAKHEQGQGLSAHAEGWARYSESLAEELGVFTVDNTRISRRAWPARGMVSDTGMHTLGWNVDKTLKYLKESGQFVDDAGGLTLIDRMAAIPAQLTSYDSGAQEIFSLRLLAQQELGDRFDLKTFHHHVLKNGNVPLWLLRQQIEAWIAEEKTKNGQ